jgi:ribonuclease III
VIDSERALRLGRLEQKLGYRFRDRRVLECALTHKSYANEQGHAIHYERLEFLGDAVVELIVSTYLYKAYPQAQEGRLSKLRAGLVSAEALSGLARQMDLGDVLMLGRGEERTGGRYKHSLLAAGLEAVLGALYLDGGYACAETVFLTCFGPVLEQRAASSQVWDYKGMLQERALSLFGCTPAYRVIHEEGPAHQKTFHIQLCLNQAYVCTGMGRSKKAAEQHAAQQLLDQLPADRSAHV